MTKNGVVTDTLENIYSWVSFSSNFMVYIDIVAGKQQILVRDLSNNTDKVVVINMKSGNNAKDNIGEFFLDSYIDKNLYWADGYGLYKTNINSLTTSTIITSCDRKAYLFFCITSDNSKIMATRIDTWIQDAAYLYSERNIFEMNPDGSNLQKINIP